MFRPMYTLLDAMLRASAAREIGPHERHQQRISFAYGNVALSYNGPEDGRTAYEASVREAVTLAAGPCPCTECVPVESRANTAPMSTELIAALVEAVKENEIP